MNTNPINKPKVLAIIPARGGSKGVLHKNVKLLDGKPLLAYTIDSAKESRHIARLILSSENETIIGIAKNLGVEVPFTRPKHLAQDDSGSLEVVQHAVKFFEQKNEYFDAVLLLQPTTPFRPQNFIDQAIIKFKNEQCDALVSVLPVPHQYNPHWVFMPDNNGNLKTSTGEDQIIKRRQDLPEAYCRDGSIYITKTKFIKQGSFFGDKLSYIESDTNKYVNIDTLEDWKKAENIVSKIKI